MLKKLLSQNPRIQVGAGTYASGEPLFRLHHPGNKISIGKYCSFAFGVTVFAGGNHPIDYVTTHAIKLFYSMGDFSDWTADCRDGEEITRIGNDVWLGHTSLILSGAEVGDGAVIGAGAVVRGRVPPYAIVIGNPAAVIRYRFDQSTIASLLEIKWWDWPEDKIKSEIEYLASPDLKEFIRRHAGHESSE